MRAYRDAVRRPLRDAAPVDTLREYSGIPVTVILPGDNGSAGAVRYDLRLALIRRIRTDTDTVRGPQPGAGGVDSLGIDIVVSVSPVLPGDDRAPLVRPDDLRKILPPFIGAERMPFIRPSAESERIDALSEEPAHLLYPDRYGTAVPVIDVVDVILEITVILAHDLAIRGHLGRTGSIHLLNIELE